MKKLSSLILMIAFLAGAALSQGHVNQGTVETVSRHIIADAWLRDQKGPRIILAAPWEFEDQGGAPLSRRGYTHDGFGAFFQTNHVSSEAGAGGSFCNGAGSAWDESIHDVVSQANAESAVWQRWRYRGSRRGDVEVVAHAEIAGEFDLINNDASGWAFGFCEWTASGFPPMEVHLERSCGQSSSGQVGSADVPIGIGGTLSIPFNPSTGESTYTDYKVNNTGGAQDMGTYFVQHRTRGDVKVAANGTPPLGRGECEAIMFGYVDSTSILGDHQ